MKMNHYYADLEESYLFSTIAKKVEDYQTGHPDSKIIRMGIGDVTLPLPEVVVSAFQAAVLEQGTKAGFHGYGPEQGYAFLREAVRNYYMSYGVELEMEDIFISDGAKSDVGNILDLFDRDNLVLIPDPVYPVYLDTNVMCGRKIIYMQGKPENDFLPMPDDSVKADIIYLCSPNNPTGAVYTKEQLEKWVAYALKNDAVILYDAAYESFISDPEIPRSIFAVEGAKKCAIELCSLSKTAGFTGTRCGYTIVPHDLVRKTKDGREMSLNKMWLRRQTTKFNGVPYIIQRGAEAVFSPEGQKQCREMLAFYKENARIMSEALAKKGIKFYGGTHSPYIWMQCPNGMGSWEFFDYLLEKLAVVGTPGAGFGSMGEGYFRLTAFGSRENTIEAMERIEKGL